MGDETNRQTDVAVLLGTRPARRRPALACLLELAARARLLFRLGPLGEDELARGLAELLGAPPHHALMTAVTQACGGSPLLVACLVRAWQEDDLVSRGQLLAPPDLAAAATTGLLAGRLGQLSGDGRMVLGALGVAGTGIVAEWLAVRRPEATAELEDWGLARPGGGGIAPLVAEAARRLLEPGERAQGEELAAGLAAQAGTSAERLAHRLWRNGSTTPTAAAAYRAAGDQLVTARPSQAAEWYRRACFADPADDAASRGLLHAALAGGDERRAQQEAERLRSEGDLDSALAAMAAVCASRGLWDDAALRLARVGAEGSARRSWWAGQQALCSLLRGDASPLPADAVSDITADAATMLASRVAAALVASAGADRAHVEGARRLLREVVALASAVDLPPDTAVSPHEAGAALALTAGEAAVARRLLAAAPRFGLRGPAVARLTAWAELRGGEATRADDQSVGGEDPRSGDGQLHDGAEPTAAIGAPTAGGVPTGFAAGGAEPGPRSGPGPGGAAATTDGMPTAAPGSAPAATDWRRSSVRRRPGATPRRYHRGGGPGQRGHRRPHRPPVRRRGRGGGAARRLAGTLPSAIVDLTNFDPVCELVVLARRFGPASLAAELEARLGDLLARLGWPPLWTARFRWARLEAAVATRDLAELTGASGALANLAESVPSLAPLAEAAAVWQEVMGGQPDQRRVEQAVALLKDSGLTWEASQLAGQAAIRIDDAAAAKSLLGRARALRGEAGAVGRDDNDRPLTRAGLSEREVEVARLVLDGLTHRDIGATLYISPKTVEHHVAHIRTKLGVTNRAEFLASLREDLAARVD